MRCFATTAPPARTEQISKCARYKPPEARNSFFLLIFGARARARPRNVSPKSITRIYSITTRSPLLEARSSSPQNSRFLGYADCTTKKLSTNKSADSRDTARLSEKRIRQFGEIRRDMASNSTVIILLDSTVCSESRRIKENKNTPFEDGYLN